MSNPERGVAQTNASSGEKSNPSLIVSDHYSKAAHLFRKAAELGDAEAQFQLGLCFRDDKGLLKDADQRVIGY
ncbi:MAG: hypothetical protein JWM16_4353 [Verrucomicrobiales bacterium]|nr:hypothetical protein [Verrucomicrobiales bacterium]